MSDLSVSKIAPPHTELAAVLARTPEVASVVLEDIADDRIWRARIGVPGIYAVHSNKNETAYVLVTSFFDCRRGRMAIRVFPISLWEDGTCVSRVAVPQLGEHLPFLPSCVLWGKCDYDRLPNEHHETLSKWADIILDGIDEYDDTHPRHTRKTRP